MEFMFSQKGHRLLVYDNYKFYKHDKTKGGLVKWRCIKKNCTAKIFTDKEEAEIQKLIVNHNHEPEKSWKRQAISNSFKTKAVEELNDRPQKLISKEISNAPSGFADGLDSKDIGYIRKNLRRVRRRREGLPTLVASTSDAQASRDSESPEGEEILPTISDDKEAPSDIYCSNWYFFNSLKFLIDKDLQALPEEVKRTLEEHETKREEEGALLSTRYERVEQTADSGEVKSEGEETILEGGSNSSVHEGLDSLHSIHEGGDSLNSVHEGGDSLNSVTEGGDSANSVPGRGDSANSAHEKSNSTNSINNLINFTNSLPAKSQPSSSDNHPNKSISETKTTTTIPISTTLRKRKAETPRRMDVTPGVPPTQTSVPMPYELEVFGKFVAEKLRKYNELTRTMIQHEITSVFANVDRSLFSQNFAGAGHMFPQNQQVANGNARCYRRNSNVPNRNHNEQFYS